MKTVRPIIAFLFAVHVVLLLLSATRFTLLTGFTNGNHDWTVNYYQLSYANGWGYVYKSDYTASQVVAYIASYALGFVVFRAAFCGGSNIIGSLGVLLCTLGVLSFVLEGSHWLMSHNLSIIVSLPAVMAVLWICLVVRWIRATRSSDAINR